MENQVKYQRNVKKSPLGWNCLYFPNKFVQKFGVGGCEVITQAEKRKDGHVWIIVGHSGKWERLSDYQQSDYDTYKEQRYCSCSQPDCVWCN